MNKKRLISIIALGAIIIGALMMTFSLHSEVKHEEKRVYSLNDTLTNEMSAIPELKKMDKKIEAFMKKWELKGVSLAIARNDSLLYAKGYGWADQENNVKMGPGNILRIASVSKLVTAAGIMKLKEEGKLSLDDKVFGPEGILSDSLYTSWIKDRHIYDITVEHLLRHQAGFGRDPLFSVLDVRQQLKLDRTPEDDDYIYVTLRKNVRFKPGESQSYSNFGYMLLSKIIERTSGQSYEEYIQENILQPAGCTDFHIAGNYYTEKRENEVRYYTHEGPGKFVPEYNGSGNMVERSNGGNNIRALSGAGAWTASPAELCRLVCSMDRDTLVPDVLSLNSINEMTEYFDSNTFSLGWNDTKPNGTWTRTGTLAGTSALVKRFPNGELWVMVTNTSTWKGPGFTRRIAQLFDQCRDLYGDNLPARDLF